MQSTVLLEVRARVATLTLNRPDALNALSEQMMADLHATTQALAQRDDFDVLVIRGAGAHFMAGGDLNDFARSLPLAPAERYAHFHDLIVRFVNPAILALHGLRQPVIACVRGACAGLGLSLMAGCDLVLAGDDARFTTAYAAIGLSGDGGASWFLPALLGPRKAAELLLLADRFDATEAARLGLVNRVVPAAALETELERWVQRLLAGPQRAHAEIRALLRGQGRDALEQQLAREAEAFARCAATSDFGEGVSAFLAKRKAVFSSA